MSQVSPGELLKALGRIGFWGRDGANHIILVYVLDGRKTRVRTIVDRHGRPFGEGRISDYCRQLGLDRDQFERLLNGQMSPEEYRRIVLTLGKV